MLSLTLMHIKAPGRTVVMVKTCMQVMHLTNFNIISRTYIYFAQLCVREVLLDSIVCVDW